MNKHAIRYTQEQLDIELLKQKNEDIYRILQRLELNTSSNFHWMLGMLCGLYTICITSGVGAFGHALGWF